MDMYSILSLSAGECPVSSSGNNSVDHRPDLLNSYWNYMYYSTYIILCQYAYSIFSDSYRIILLLLLCFVIFDSRSHSTDHYCQLSLPVYRFNARSNQKAKERTYIALWLDHPTYCFHSFHLNRRFCKRLNRNVTAITTKPITRSPVIVLV